MGGFDFRAVFESTANAYAVLDRELRYVAANPAYLALVGTELSAIEGRGLFDVFPQDPADPERAPSRLLRASFEKVLQTRAPDVLAYVPYRVPRGAGGEPEQRIWSATHTPVLDEHGEVAWILQHTQDVTALHRTAPTAAEALDRAAQVQRAASAVDEQLRGLRAMFEQAPGFVAFLRGPEHVFELCNAACERLVGRRELLGKTFREALPDLNGQGYDELLDRVYRTKQPFVGRGTRVDFAREGVIDRVYLDYVFQPIFDPGGDTLGIVIAGHEVTEQKRAELRQQFVTRASEQLAASAEDVEAALVRVAEAAVATLADFAIVDLYEGDTSRRLAVAHADPAHAELARALARYPSPAARPPTHLLRGLGDKPHVIPDYTDELKRGSAQNAAHLELLRAMGSRSVLALPLIHRGRSYGVVALFSARSGHKYDERDLPAMEELGRVVAAALDNARLTSERAELLAREQAARERAEAANRAKDEFLAMLGHELRSPLSPILTAVQLMRLRGDTSSAREQAIIERQAQHLVRLLDDLLDVSRIAGGKIQLLEGPVEIAVIVAKAIEIASPLLDQKGHQLAVDVPARGLRVYGDEARLTQVIANLLTNAARYTERGGHVWLGASLEREQAVIRVRDDGRGIDPEMLPKIFELFVQAGPKAEAGEGGLGLGLTLVKRLVEMHRGTVSASSPGPGQGAEFVIRLPALAALVPVPDLPSRDQRHNVSTGRRVLLVDDNADAALLLGEVLLRRGHQVTIAHDGLEGVRMAIEEEPEVAIIDIGLPGIDGYELARRVREQLGQRAPRMIALTGYGAEHDRAKSLAAGFAAHLTKPVDSKTLLRLLDPARAA